MQEDAKAAADVVGAETGAVAITKSDIVIAPQAHTPSGPTNALTKKPLTA